MSMGNRIGSVASALVAGVLACWSAGCGGGGAVGSPEASPEPRDPAEPTADWRDSLQMARAMLLFDRPRAALLYARSALVLSEDATQRSQAETMLDRSRQGCLAQGLQEAQGPSGRRDRLARDGGLTRYRVAVLPFERGRDGWPTGRGRLLAELLLDEFRPDRYQPVERVQFNRVVAEQDLAQALDAESLRTVRRDVGADLLVVGTIHAEPGATRVVARLVDTAGADVIQSADVIVSRTWDARGVARRLAEALQLTDAHRRERREGRLASSWLARAEDLADAGEMEAALETYVDLLAIESESVGVRRSFAAFQRDHAAGLRFEIPREPDPAPRGPRRLRLRIGESAWMDLVELPPPPGRQEAIWMGATEVTQGQYLAVMRTRPSFRRGDDLPVEGVSLFDARAFCRELSRRLGVTVRLPSVSEWEYACRAGTTTAFSFGPECTFERANVARLAVERPGATDGGPGRTMPVGTYPPNAWGLYDMHGNVAEWCLPEAWDGPPDGPREQDAPSRCPTRGGSWMSHAREARSDASTPAGPTGRTGDVGFRVVVESPDRVAPRQD